MKKVFTIVSVLVLTILFCGNIYAYNDYDQIGLPAEVKDNVVFGTINVPTKELSIKVKVIPREKTWGCPPTLVENVKIYTQEGILLDGKIVRLDGIVTFSFPKKYDSLVIKADINKHLARANKFFSVNLDVKGKETFSRYFPQQNFQVFNQEGRVAKPNF